MNAVFFHLKIKLRNVQRNGIYSVINIAGLAVGLTVCVLLIFWLQDELSFNKFHTRGKDIYQTVVRFNGTDMYWPIAPAQLAFAAKEEIPEIENTCRYYSSWGADMLKSVTSVSSAY